MPKSKYESIYKDLKQKIEEEEYPYQEAASFRKSTGTDL